MNLSELLSSSELWDQVRHALLVVGPEGTLRQVNDAATQLLGQDAERLCGQGLSRVFPKDPVLASRMEQVLATGKEFRLSTETLSSPPLAGKVVEMVLSPLFDPQGFQVGGLMSLLDTTSLHEARTRDQEEQFAQSLGLLVASLAHEVQNPLGGVKGLLQLHERELESRGMETETVGMMLGELARVERLLRHLLFLSHPMPITAEPFNIHELLGTILEFEQSVHPKVRFRKRFDPSLPEVRGERDKLHQVFLNLIRNAAEASSEQGTVTLRTEHCRPWELAGTNLDPQRGYLLVFVEDEGPGVLPEHRERLFQPLFTTKSKGHGLGLSICQRILQAHGGMLRYHSRPEGGASFQAFLPRNVE